MHILCCRAAHRKAAVLDRRSMGNCLCMHTSGQQASSLSTGSGLQCHVLAQHCACTGLPVTRHAQLLVCMFTARGELTHFAGQIDCDVCETQARMGTIQRHWTWRGVESQCRTCASSARLQAILERQVGFVCAWARLSAPRLLSPEAVPLERPGHHAGAMKATPDTPATGETIRGLATCLVPCSACK